jgi:hypothetical protein
MHRVMLIHSSCLEHGCMHQVPAQASQAVGSMHDDWPHTCDVPQECAMHAGWQFGSAGHACGQHLGIKTLQCCWGQGCGSMAVGVAWLQHGLWVLVMMFGCCPPVRGVSDVHGMLRTCRRPAGGAGDCHCSGPLTHMDGRCGGVFHGSGGVCWRSGRRPCGSCGWAWHCVMGRSGGWLVGAEQDIGAPKKQQPP